MRVNIEHDGLINDIFGFTCHFISHNVYALSHFLEIEELFAWDFFKYRPRLCIIMQVIQPKL